MLLFLTSIAYFIVITHSECPKINDLPVMTSSGDKFYCAFGWDGYGGEDPLEGCNDGDGGSDYRYSWMDGDDSDAGYGYLYPTGSLITKVGCVFYGYQDHDYTGERCDYPGPATYSNGCSGSCCPNTPSWHYILAYGFHSIKCRCEQDPIICTPTDGWHTIMQCDNCQSDVETLCQYTKTIGTTYTSEAQESMSIDVTIEESMSTSFFKLFETQIGISLTTGYDWTQTSSEAKSETHEYTVRTTVKPGELLVIEGAHGDCGGNVVHTELFRITTMDCDGNILNEIFKQISSSAMEMAFKNKQFRRFNLKLTSFWK